MLPVAYLALLTAIVPIAVGAGLSRWTDASASSARRLTVASAAVALVCAVAASGVLAWSGGASVSASVFVFDPTGLAAASTLYIDALTCIMLVMVSVVGLTVSLFAVRYLDQDPGQTRFSQWLAFTLGAVMMLIISGNLVMLWLAWVGSSLGLHKLLTFYKDRPAARLAARKKFLISRLGDGLLLVGFGLIYLQFGSVEYTAIFEAKAGLHSGAPWSTLAAVFLVLGACTKSAQFPLHTWLPDTMETPTPVSALMHAGIINAGGFLLIRLSPVLVQSPAAMGLLSAVGAVTAVFASAVMLTQTDIKRKLAYSTISQMGFMMLQIGLGAFALAVLHIVGHSFYKAHAFSSASSVVKSRGLDSPPRPLRLGLALSTLAASALVVIALALAFGVSFETKPGGLLLSGVLALAVAQLVLASHRVSDGSAASYGLALLAGAGMGLTYFVFGAGLQSALHGVVPVPMTMMPSLQVVLLGLFTFAFVLQLSLPRLAATDLGRRLYVHAHNGFYLGVLQDRLVRRLMPDRVAAR